MRKIREVLRLTYELRLSVREVRAATGIGKTAVSEYVRRAKVIGITWPIPDELDDTTLERRLFDLPGESARPGRVMPDRVTVHDGLKRRGVTLEMLWSEYRAACPDGIGYTQSARDLIDMGPRSLQPDQMQLIRSHVLESEPVGRAAEMAREVGHGVDLGLLRRGRQIAHGHVIDHAAAQRAHRQFNLSDGTPAVAGSFNRWLPSPECVMIAERVDPLIDVLAVTPTLNAVAMHLGRRLLEARRHGSRTPRPLGGDGIDALIGE